jgi:formate/nitrite transporter FocA (FNT family)
MAGEHSTEEIFARAVREGERRLSQPWLELVSTSFIAGFTVVFGIVALGVVEATTEPYGSVSRLAGALAFGVGVVFLVAGRVELFNENFADPAAAVLDPDGSWGVASLGRLWTVTFAFNLLGGCLFALVFAVDGVLEPGTGEVLRAFAEEATRRSVGAYLASGIAGGALVSALSFLLVTVDREGSRLALAYVVGVLLALGPFDHIVVTALHVYVGVLFGARVTPGALLVLVVAVTAGNVVGGLGLVTLTHVFQVKGARMS